MAQGQWFNPQHKRNERKQLGISPRKQRKIQHLQRFKNRIYRRLYLMGHMDLVKQLTAAQVQNIETAAEAPIA